MFVPILSRGTFVSNSYSILTLNANSPIDNVLLEYQIAVELQKRNLIELNKSYIGTELEILNYGICKILDLDFVFYNHVEDSYDCLMTVKIQNSENIISTFKKRISFDFDLKNQIQTFIF